MIYDNLIKVDNIADLQQVDLDTDNYQKFFKVEKDDIVVDIGAHVGFFSKKAINAGAKQVFAIEPDPLFFTELSKIEGITAENCAIDKQCGVAFIESNGNANTINKESGKAVVTYDFKTLISDSFKRVDFLKVDCEGAEYDIFTDGNINWIKNNVNKIAGEFHIHNEKHKLLLPYVLYLFEENNIKYVLTSVDGVILTKKQILDNLDYYKEINFFALTKDSFNIKQTINTNYVNGCFVEILGGADEKYFVEFLNAQNGERLYYTEIGKDSWAKCNFEYFIDWKINIYNSQLDVIKSIDLDLKDRRVLISFESKSLGDTLAWFPYVEEFRKKHDCELFVSTFLNELFEKQYPDITFINPGQEVAGLTAMYKLGWFYNGNEMDLYRHPTDPKKQPMQKTASDILGIKYKPIKPMIYKPNVVKENIIGLGIHSTAQAKYWNNPEGWSDVATFIRSINHVPLLLSSEGSDYMGNIVPSNVDIFPKSSLRQLIVQMCKTKAFIGVGSGLSWLAWACDVPVILISGFSEPYTEFPCYRVTIKDENVCTGCFNRTKLDAGDWNWCPEHKGTDRQFECSKLIESKPIIETIKSIIND